MNGSSEVNTLVLEEITAFIQKTRCQDSGMNEELLSKVVDSFQVKGMPIELKEILFDDSFKRRLLADRDFAGLCGLPFSSMDEHWPAIYAGFALYCQQKYG